MSEMFPLFGEDGDGPEGRDPDRDASDRRRSLWTLAVVLVFAVAVAAVAILALHSPGQSRVPNGDNQALPTQVITDDSTSASPTATPVVATPTSTSGTPSRSASPRPSRTAASSRPPSSSAARTTPTPTPTPTLTTSTPPTGPCGATMSPCIVDGGLAGAAEAASAYRAGVIRHPRLGPVTAALTPEAKACALAEVEGSSCTLPRPFADATNLRTQNATDAVIQVTRAPGNIFDDVAMTSFEVGWAYDPVSELYACVFIEN